MSRRKFNLPSVVSAHGVYHAHSAHLKAQAAQRIHADLRVTVCVLVRLKMTLVYGYQPLLIKASWRKMKVRIIKYNFILSM